MHVVIPPEEDANSKPLPIFIGLPEEQTLNDVNLISQAQLLIKN